MSHKPAAPDQRAPEMAAPLPVAPPRRKKQWATKARTGCLSCRSRRVKCNEGRPKCAACGKRNTTCHYEIEAPIASHQCSTAALLHVPPHIGYEKSPAVGDWDVSPAELRGLIEYYLSNVQNPTERAEERQYLEQLLYINPGPWHSEFAGRGPVPGWRSPPGWETIEALAFRNAALAENARNKDLAESRHRALCRPTPYNPANDITIAGILCMRIGRIVRHENMETARPTPSTVHLWARLQQLLYKAVQRLSIQITDTENVIKNNILQTICDMTAIEEYLNMGGTRAHLRGFLVVLRLCKTAPIELALKTPGVGAAAQSLIICGVLSNTLSSCDAQFHEITDFTDKELIDIYHFTLYNECPCPSFLWVQILKITKLRRIVASGADSLEVRQAKEEIFNEISTFNPAQWEEKYTIPTGSTAALMASIFKAAVSIYCCASVSVPAAGEDTEDHQSATWSLSIIARQRRTLLDQLNEAFIDQRMRRAIAWPLAVAGYAASKGSYADRALVTQLLTDMRLEVGPGPAKLRQRLQSFYLYPGEGRWDDCWRGAFTYII